MFDAIPQRSTASESSLRASMRLHSALLLIWLRPQVTLVGLAGLSGWSWCIPLGLALGCFYTRFFTIAVLGVPLQDWALTGGVAALLLGWPVRTALLYGLSRWLREAPDFFMLLTLSVWATLPLTLRSGVQVVYMLRTGKLLTNPGLSGLLADLHATVPMIKLWQYLLGWLDLFTLWHLALLVLAVSIGAQVSMRKAAFIVTVYSILTLFFTSIILLF